MIKYLKNGIIAQLVEHMPYKHRVTGSSPVGSTKMSDISDIFCFYGEFYFQVQHFNKIALCNQLYQKRFFTNLVTLLIQNGSC